MNIIGISAFYHESTCCLLVDGALVAAAPEERFTRVKFDRRAPVNAFRFCLQTAGLTPADVDCVAYYEDPEKKLSRQLSMGLDASVDPTFAWLDPGTALRRIRDELGYDGPIEAFDHHRSHAAGAFFFSGFTEAAVLTVDGVGEWATTTYGVGRGTSLQLFDEVVFPDSLGLFYSALTDFLGFEVLSDEYKVMGLAPYGRPRFVDQLRSVLHVGDGGSFALDRRFFDFRTSGRMYTPALGELLGVPPRQPESDVLPVHEDLACSLQRVLEDALLHKVRWLHDRVPVPNLCLSGGVALNCVANGRIRREGPFRDVFVSPAAGDSGSALGAAALAWMKHAAPAGPTYAPRRIDHVFVGPSSSSSSIASLLQTAGIDAIDCRDREDDLLARVVEHLQAGRVVAWFHGRMELGPRALGARSILADPRDPTMRDRLNAAVKKREAFRPFAPAVLVEHASAHFDLDHASPFMTETCAVRSSIALPAVTHVDGSARVQTVDRQTSPRFARLLEAFHARTGCPVLVNTSFNVRGEPIVCTPEDALRCMASTGIDCLVLEDFVVERAHLPPTLPRAIALAHAGFALGVARADDVVDARLAVAGGAAVERWTPADGALPRGVYTFT
jgi:carbamoyltransferase